MKNLILITFKILVIALLITNFSNCTDNVKTEENIGIASVSIEETFRKPLVFIAGIDKGEQKYYKNARLYFLEKEYEIVNDAYSIEEIISWLNTNYNGNKYGEIHIVAHGNPWSGISLETTIKGERTTVYSLKKASLENTLPKLTKAISKKTKIIFHSCGLGENTNLMSALGETFSATEKMNIVASPYYSIFDGNFSDLYLAKPYYVFYPTAKSPGKTDLSKEIAKKYPSEKEIDWFNALNNEEERYVGEAYTYQYNIPVNFEIDFSSTDNEIPVLKNKQEIIDFILGTEDLASAMNAMKIPLEKYRWNAKISNNKLIIKGKTTVLCVLKPIINAYGDLEHLEPKIDNKRLYATN